MRRTRLRRSIVGILFLALLAPLSGCAPSDEVDGVLWRQIAEYKDPFGRTLSDSLGEPKATFATNLANNELGLPGHFWDGSSNPQSLSLDDGGLVFFGLDEDWEKLRFNVLISSGPRSPEDDPLDDGRRYAGPPEIYTCFEVTIKVGEQASRSMFYKDVACDDRLVSELDDDAKRYPVNVFNG